MPALRFLDEALAELATRDLLRSPSNVEGAIVLCSNDYLGYAARGIDRALRVPSDLSFGAGASRLVSGQQRAHAALERTLADWVGMDDALVFASGYAANIGLLSSLAGEGDVIISDALNHASLIDGCRLSRADVKVARHGDASDVERLLGESASARRRFVVTEAYFSMDGDVPDLGALRRIADRYDAALVVDEAHSLGIFGPRGAGLCREADVAPDVLIGTLGKAVGVQGAFVAGPSALKTWLWNRARSFVFSTGTSPWLAEVTRARVEEVIGDDAARSRLASIVNQVRHALARSGASILPSRGPIVPWLCGTPQAALSLRDWFLERGFFVQAIRPPTVPEGTSRLRMTLRADLEDDELSRLLDLLRAWQDRDVTLQSREP